MAKRVIHPFETLPRTTQHTDRGGHLIYEIEARALTPRGKKLAEFTGFLSTLGTLFGGIVAVDTIPAPEGWEFPAVIVSALISLPLQQKFWGREFRIVRRLRITSESFSFKTLWGWKHYDRSVPHSFGLERHDRTQIELDAIDYKQREAAQKGQVHKVRRYYTESCHLVFRYLGQRIDVMDIYGRTEAAAILDRINACEELIEGHRPHGQGTSLSAEGDWKRGSAGTLPGPKRQGRPALPAPKKGGKAGDLPQKKDHSHLVLIQGGKRDDEDED